MGVNIIASRVCQFLYGRGAGSSLCPRQIAFLAQIFDNIDKFCIYYNKYSFQGVESGVNFLNFYGNGEHSTPNNWRKEKFTVLPNGSRTDPLISGVLKLNNPMIT